MPFLLQAVGNGELEANYSTLANSLRDSGFSHDRFHEDFLKMCHAMTAEQSVDVATVPKQRFLTLRRETSESDRSSRTGMPSASCVSAIGRSSCG